MKEAHDLALRGLVVVAKMGLTEDYTNRFLGIREAFSKAVFLLERNDREGLKYLDVAIESTVKRFGVSLTVKMLGIEHKG